jgi:uncharacterized repeat protein (TIGR03943 family)
MINKKMMNGINALLIVIVTLYLFWINKIGYFINSNYYWYLLVSVSITALLTSTYLWFAFTDKHTTKPATKSQLVFFTLLVAIFISLFAVNIKPLGAESSSYAKRGNIKRDTQKAQYIARSPEAISSLSLIDWFNLVTQSPNPNQYNGQKTIVKGFVSNTTDSGFDLSLYQVSCCVVDAQLYTIPVKSSQQIPAKDSWLNVEGILDITGQKPNTKYQLSLIKSEITETPADPYKSK